MIFRTAFQEFVSKAFFNSFFEVLWAMYQDPPFTFIYEYMVPGGGDVGMMEN